MSTWISTELCPSQNLYFGLSRFSYLIQEALMLFVFFKFYLLVCFPMNNDLCLMSSNSVAYNLFAIILIAYCFLMGCVSTIFFEFV